MPIHSCTLPDGGSGYKWGDKGVCYPTRAQAEKQAEAAYANGYTGDCIALDRAAVSARTKDSNGHLHVADVPITRAEINEYLGKEIPGYKELGLEPDRKYKLLRDPEELKKAVETFNGKPILDKHRPQYADDHDRKRTVGSMHGAYWDDPFVRAKDFYVWDGDAIADIESGETSDISCGYHYRPDMVPGTFKGEKFDGVMRDISANHEALVPDGRVTGCMVLDSALPALSNGETTMKVSRKAQIARGALAVYLRPKLATDAVIDYRALVAGVTAANWPTAKGELVTRVKTAVRGKLAQDATMADIKEMLDCLDKEGEAKDEDPDMMDAAGEESAEEKRMREEKEAQDAEEAETEEEKEERMRRRAEAKDKGAKDKAARDKAAKDAKDKAARDKGARDSETPEAKEKREREEKEAADRAARDEEPKVTKAAMDAALATQAREIKLAMRRDQQLLEEAKEIVQPVVGRILAQDSAEAVYGVLFQAQGVDITGVPPAAYKALAVQTVRAAKATSGQPRQIGMDAAASKDFASRFPGAAAVRFA